VRLPGWRRRRGAGPRGAGRGAARRAEGSRTPWRGESGAAGAAGSPAGLMGVGRRRHGVHRPPRRSVRSGGRARHGGVIRLVAPRARGTRQTPAAARPCDAARPFPRATAFPCGATAPRATVERRFPCTRAPPGGRVHRNRYYATVSVHSTAPPRASVQKPAPNDATRPLAAVPVRECTETVAADTGKARPRAGAGPRRRREAVPRPAPGSRRRRRRRPRLTPPPPAPADATVATRPP
jgi:hypothetical protein